MIFQFEITGQKPLIMHNDSIDGADEVAAWINDPERKQVSVPGDDRTPVWKWHISLYHDGTHVVIPGDNLMASIRYGASRVRIDDTGKSRTTFEKLSQSGLLIHEEGLVLTVPDRPVLMKDVKQLRELPFAEQARKVQGLGFQLYTKRVVVNKKRNIRVRPRFDRWAARGTIQILDEAITPEALRRILEAAGRVAGLMDRRPGARWPISPGPFGTYAVKLKAA